jgi:hypothetical protein
MDKLLSKIKSTEDFKRFCEVLTKRMEDGDPISDNAMIDGMVIGFILTSGICVEEYFLQKHIGRLWDGTIQKLENIIIWCTNNEEKLCDVYETN